MNSSPNIDSVVSQNRAAWNERARQRKSHTRTVLAKDLKDPLPVLDPEGWLGMDVRGKRALCLASGGGLQSALMAAAGARVTVLDASDEMLALDVQIAKQHGFVITTKQGSMDNLSCFPESSFDIVLQPVSSCYIPDISKMYAEVARIISRGGVYVSQHKQPINLQTSAVPSPAGYLLTEPYRGTGPLPPVEYECDHRERGTIEFLHRWEDLLGALCRQGFVIEDLVEPHRVVSSAEPGSFAHRSHFIPPYVKIKARRVGNAVSGSVLWAP